ncbi:sensor histidine kinase [Spirosoma endophyticum]|uniref:Oxygen sensor histidine kinase NreB n=1 Tax=Spirosoma endophyticum TaxID=662367 RepID=A0A1I2HTY8_9BACT|nr:sensor histidine kinase [Spirosoma endophyticum]SFF33514.1 Signal transduction histidine kinase [Spirosoma endophyticum]
MSEAYHGMIVFIGISGAAIIMAITGIVVLLLMALFGVRFIIHYHRRRREVLMEKQLMQEVFQRELLQAQLETQNQTLQQIAQELHDNVGQLLTVIVMRLNSLDDKYLHPEPAIEQTVLQTRDLVQTVIMDVRALSKTLDYDTVRRFGLTPSLTLELERIEQIGRIHTDFVMSGGVYSLGEETEIVLLRMAQESINNALKHANAHTITVSTAYKPDSFILTVADDGQGFNIEEANARILEKAGAGLNNLHRRAGLLGGTCVVDSQVGGGTRVQIRLPHNRMI